MRGGYLSLKSMTAKTMCLSINAKTKVLRGLCIGEGSGTKHNHLLEPTRHPANSGSISLAYKDISGRVNYFHFSDHGNQLEKFMKVVSSNVEEALHNL